MFQCVAGETLSGSTIATRGNENVISTLRRSDPETLSPYKLHPGRSRGRDDVAGGVELAAVLVDAKNDRVV